MVTVLSCRFSTLDLIKSTRIWIDETSYAPRPQALPPRQARPLWAQWRPLLQVRQPSTFEGPFLYVSPT